MERHSFRIVSGECTFPQNFNTRKLDEITVFSAVYLNEHRPSGSLLAYSLSKQNLVKRTHRLDVTTLIFHFRYYVLPVLSQYELPSIINY